MNSDHLTPDLALKLIGRLRQGKNVIFGANFFSVGRDLWIRGAEQIFTDVERTHDSFVRFIRGDYGVGKTNFSARLFHNALQRGWTAVYIELSAELSLHEFHHVFSEITRRMYVPEQLTSGFDSLEPVGLLGVLELHFKRLRDAVGMQAGADVSARSRGELMLRVNSLLRTARVYGEFASAIRAYFEARIDGDKDTIRTIEGWLNCDPGSCLPSRGIFKPIQKNRGKELLRSVSALLDAIGYKGVLIIMDELESIMEESRSRRRKAYTTLRELMDNVDGENGMKSTCFYLAAPPGQFDSQKGFIEVEALASRIQAALVGQAAETDYTSTIVDLDQTPITVSEQMELAKRLIQIHGVARSWNPESGFQDAEIAALVKEIGVKRPLSDLRIREFCIEVISTLERKYAAA